MDQLYREGMFHGPCFQAVKSIDRYGEDGNIATLEIPRRDDMLRSIRRMTWRTGTRIS